MSVSTYAYVNARIGGMKSYLLKDEDFRSLIESRNLEEITSQLKNTQYGLDVSDPNVLSLELQLKKSLYRDYMKLVNCVEGKPREFVHNMAKKFEVETLKSIIKMKFLNVMLAEYLIPFGQIDDALIEKLLKAGDISGLIEELKGTDYYLTLKEVYQTEKDKPTPEDRDVPEQKDLPFLIALETLYFEDVKTSMDRLSRKDKSMVKKFVGFNIDLSNLIMALRLRGVEGDVEGYFIDGGDSFSLKNFKWVRNLENISRLPEVVPRKFVSHVSEGMEKYAETDSLIFFEIIAKRQLLKESKKLFLGNRFHIGTIIAYLNLKENEISNLIKIIKTKDEFFPAKDIEELLIQV